jgi:hypothetical protein
MELLLFLLSMVALGILLAQFLAHTSVARRYLPPVDSSQASTPDPIETMFDRINSLFQASLGRPLASAQTLWEGNASETSRRLAAQGGVTTSLEQAILLQQAY